jgi:NAD(P)-dependent dehydrogenase (short-subunit alcohol dehydrogenase family)
MAMVSFDISGKRVLIIGASSGLGLVLAREFVACGARVTIVAEVPEVLDAARKLSEESGSLVRGIVCDVTVRPAVNTLAADVGEVDVLINNAALTVETPVSDDGDESAYRFERTLDVNVTGLYWVTQAFLKTMPDGGRVIFTSSLWGKTAGPGYSAYVASKHALLGLVRTLAAEVGPRGISVNAVCPHAIQSEASLHAPKEVVEAATSKMLLRPGLIPPEDIVGMYVFLASPASSEITGQALSVDRGAAAF